MKHSGMRILPWTEVAAGSADLHVELQSLLHDRLRVLAQDLVALSSTLDEIPSWTPPLSLAARSATQSMLELCLSLDTLLYRRFTIVPTGEFAQLPIQTN